MRTFFVLPLFFSVLCAYAHEELAQEKEILQRSLMIDQQDDPLENETFSYKAKKISIKAAKIDVSKIAQEAVHTCYNAYKPTFDWQVAKEKQKLSNLGAADSSYVELAVIQCAQSFASAIVNQLTTISHQLNAADKNMFWNVSEMFIKQVLSGFCQEHGVKSTEYLNEQIGNMIKMKKVFG